MATLGKLMWSTTRNWVTTNRHRQIPFLDTIVQWVSKCHLNTFPVLTLTTSTGTVEVDNDISREYPTQPGIHSTNPTLSLIPIGFFDIVINQTFSPSSSYWRSSGRQYISIGSGLSLINFYKTHLL